MIYLLIQELIWVHVLEYMMMKLENCSKKLHIHIENNNMKMNLLDFVKVC